MKGIKHRSKIQKGIKNIISSAFTDEVSDLFKEIKDFQELAEKILEQDQEKYKKYFEKYMIHETNLLKIEYRKIEMNYKDSMFRTNKRAEVFEKKLADPNLNQDMDHFYRREYLNILKPVYVIEQVLENYGKYLEVLRITMEEFSEWFFLKRADFLKQLLQPFIVKNETSRKERETWIYKKYAKQITSNRRMKMYKRVGLKIK